LLLANGGFLACDDCISVFQIFLQLFLLNQALLVKSMLALEHKKAFMDVVLLIVRANHSSVLLNVEAPALLYELAQLIGQLPTRNLI
jgi:hypothetical protein